MSKTDTMNSKDAAGYLQPFDDYFSAENFTDVDQTLAKNKKTDEAIVKIVLSKYSDDAKVSFDPLARTMLLILMRTLYGSANANGFNNDVNPSALSKGFKTGTLQYNLWKWVAGLIEDHGDWNDIKMSEIPPHFEEISEMFSRSEDHKMDEHSTVFAHTVFLFIVDSVSLKISKLFSDTTECGAKGLTVKGFMLRGYFNDMNPGAANPEIFMMIYNAATAFTVVKKEWAEVSKKIKTQARDDAKAAKEAEKKKKDAAKEKAKAK